MTDYKRETSDAITRCAVCKIDLKGRFVYLDSQVEKLLGQKREDLFGKSILDYLDTPSQDVIQKLTAQRNHYESFFDSAKITLLNRSRRETKVTAVISLNFNAGNPVNFIIIMTPDNTTATGSLSAQHTIAFQAFLENILQERGVTNWREFLHHLRLFAGARQAGLYIIHDRSLEPLSADSDDNDTEFSFSTLPEITEIHHRVAASGYVYDFTSQEHYAEAIELFKTAPDEFITRIEIGEEAPYLLRLVYDNEVDLNVVSRYLNRVTMTLKLIGRLPGTDGANKPGDTANDEINIHFVVGLLDSLRCGAALSDSEGKIIGYNPTFINMLQTEKIADDIRTLAGQICRGESSDIEEKFTACYLDTNLSTEPCRYYITLPSGNEAILSVVRLADSPDDLTSCIVLLPQNTEKKPTVSSGFSFWNSAVQTMLEELEQTVLETQKLENEYHSKRDKRGGAELSRVSKSLKNSQERLKKIRDMLQLAGSSDDTEDITDLGVLVPEVFLHVQKAYPEIKAQLRHGVLPKIKTRKKWLSVILEKIFASRVKDLRSPIHSLNVQAQVTDGRCRIDILDQSALPEKKKTNTAPKTNSPSSSNNQNKDTSAEIAEIRFLVEASQGEVMISSNKQEGTTVSIEFPVSDFQPSNNFPDIPDNRKEIPTEKTAR